MEITRLRPNHFPFRPEGEDEIPELQLEYHDIELYPIPVWQQDSLMNKRPAPTKIKGHHIDKKK